MEVMFSFNEFNINTTRIEDPKWENWVRVLITGISSEDTDNVAVYVEKLPGFRVLCVGNHAFSINKEEATHMILLILGMNKGGAEWGQ